MKFHTKYLWFNTQNHREYINITHEVEQALEESGIQEGMILEKQLADLNAEQKEKTPKMVKCPHCGEEFEL